MYYVLLSLNSQSMAAACRNLTDRYKVIFESCDNTNNQVLCNNMEELIKEIQLKGDYTGLVLEYEEDQPYIKLIKTPGKGKALGEPKVKSQEAHIQKAIQFIKENYNQNLTIKDVCDHIKVSSPYLHKIFAKHLDKTPYQYIMDYKISKAKEYIRNTDYTIEEIARESGFINRSHFSTAFKRKEGVSPLTYRKSL